MTKTQKPATPSETCPFQRLDIVELTDPHNVVVVFAEDPQICKARDEVCLIVGHGTDWDLVGTFMSISEVMSQGPRLYVRPLSSDELSPRRQALLEAVELIDGDRNVTYGTPTQNFTNIAAFWNVQFAHLLRDGAVFSAANVAQANALQKLARMIAQPKADNWIDLAGYAACGFECEQMARVSAF